MRLLELRVGRREQHDRQLRVVPSQTLEDVEALLAAQLFDRAAALVLRFVLGEEALLGNGEVEVEHRQVGELRLPGERLGCLAVVVRT